MYAIERTWKAQGRKTITEWVPDGDERAEFGTKAAAQVVLDQFKRCSGWYINLPTKRWAEFKVSHEIVVVS